MLIHCRFGDIIKNLFHRGLRSTRIDHTSRLFILNHSDLGVYHDRTIIFSLSYVCTVSRFSRFAFSRLQKYSVFHLFILHRENLCIHGNASSSVLAFLVTHISPVIVVYHIVYDLSSVFSRNTISLCICIIYLVNGFTGYIDSANFMLSMITSNLVRGHIVLKLSGFDESQYSCTTNRHRSIDIPIFHILVGCRMYQIIFVL